MSNSGFWLTDPGLADAANASPGGPYLHVHTFRCGTGVNYTPARNQQALVGSIVYTGTPLTYNVIDGDTIDVVLQMDNSVGPFTFGEVGLYSSSNVLLAVCTFTELQSKVRALGPQAGNVWRVHARLKLAQAPVVCMVTVINSSSLLEVPNWQNLAAPINQISMANAIIVHEQNASADSVLVIRENDLEWATLGYGRIFDGNISDSGVTATTTSITHPGLNSVYLELPSSNSRYLARFSDGSIRKVVSQTGSTNITWSPAIGAVPTGAFSLWEDATTINNGFPVASAYEYNYLGANLNRYWSTPSGTYPATNAGINETAVPTLSNRPSASQWEILRQALIRIMQLLSTTGTSGGIVYTDVTASDFIARPNNPLLPGVATLNRLYEKYRVAIEGLDALRNSVNPFWLESVAIPNTTRTRSLPFVSISEYTVQLTSSNAQTSGLVNGGGGYVFTSTSDNANVYYTAFNQLFTAIGSVVVKRASTASTNGVGTGQPLGALNLTSTGVLLYEHSIYSAPLAATLYYRLFGQRLSNGNMGFTVQLQIVRSTVYDYSYTTQGTMSHTMSLQRPSATLINAPVHPIPAAATGGTF